MRRQYRSFRPQFSLRTSLVCTLLVASGLAYIVRQDQIRRQLIADLEDVGGSVKYDDSIFAIFQSSQVCEVTIPYPKFSKIETSQLKSFSSLTAVNLTDVTISLDDGLKLRCSRLKLTSITDEMLDRLGSR